jgi:uncharacterized protein YodC (DUF2158 family)
MATKFKRGDVVAVKAVIPNGPILAYRMDDAGVVYCLLEWVDVDGSIQQRWFKEDDMIGA